MGLLEADTSQNNILDFNSFQHTYENTLFLT